MALYNTSNLSVNNIADGLNRVNELEPSAGILILFIAGMIILVALLAQKGVGLAKAGTAAGFATAVFALYLQPLGIIDPRILITAILVATVAAAYAVIKFT